MKILLVEDSATLRYTMEAYIKEAGHHSIVAESGEKAVQIVESDPIDMILMDVEMPGLNGFETTRLIREILQDQWIPIIFVSGKSDEDSFEEGIAVGGDDYLIKPVSKVILQAKIKAMERIAMMRAQLHKLNAELTQLSQRDSLTQLLNRRAFDERANEAWRLASRAKQPLSILLFDIDYFKKYNDRYGHPAGDECIKLVANAAKECCHRPGDIVGRYGGEEFIVLLPNTDHKGTEHIAENLRATIAECNIEHLGSIEHQKVTISVGGCALKYTTGTKLEDLISSADEALYRCKNKGRNCTDVNKYLNLHKVLYVDMSGDRAIDLEEILDEHCKLETISAAGGLDELSITEQPELVLLSVESAQDPSISIYKKLRDKYRLSLTPLLLMSSLDKSELKNLGKTLSANGSIPLPIDPHKTIAKIDQYVSTE